jgi:HD-like signal output (HDOD) protein
MQESDTSKIISFEKKLYQYHLPILDNTLLMVEEKLSREQFRYEQLEYIFHLDPMCLFNFLTCANKYTQNINSNFKKTVKTPKHASMLLGMDNIKKCIGKLTTLKTIENQAVAYKIEQLACRSLHCAYQARHMARLLNDKAEEEIFLSALMMSLAELFIWFISPKKAQQYELLIYTESMLEVDAQLEVFGFNFVDLMTHMRPQWRLPKLYIEALKTADLDGAKKSIICINLADKLSRLADFGWYYQDMYEHLDYCDLLMPFSAQRLVKEFHLVAAQMSNDMTGFYQFALPFCALLLYPVKIPYFPVLRLKEKQHKAIISKQIKNSAVKQVSQVKVKPHIKLEEATNLPTLIKITINKLFESGNFDQVILLLLDKSKKGMTIHIEKTKLTDSVIQKKVAIKPNKNIFSFLLEIPQPIFINLSNYEKYTKLITKQITDVLPSRDFFAKSFYYKKKPIGIFYVTSKKPLNTDNYSFFNITLVNFENNLSRLR